MPRRTARPLQRLTRMMRIAYTWLGTTAVATALSLSGCGGSSSPPPGGTTPLGPGSPVAPASSAAETAERQAVNQALSEVKSLTPAAFAARYPVPAWAPLSYDPAAATNFDLIQASALKLNAAETQALKTKGFVITDRYHFPSFAYGYAAIYGEDLPVFVSADSIMYAVHRSYDDLLKAIETDALVPDMQALLAGMRSQLGSGALADLGGAAAADADLYLALAASLLEETGTAAPVAGAKAAEIAKLVGKARAAAGAESLALFGAQRLIDFSQFKPRGHYTDTPSLTRYFQAMMWLGRIDFRIIETQADGSQVFRRPQFMAAYGLLALLTPEARTRFSRIDRTIGAFVGESDNMTVSQFDALLTALGTTTPGAVSALTDQAIVSAVVTGDFGRQRISSHYMVNGLGQGTLPLSRTFLLLGQRYVLDSHVFSNVVYDRVQQGKVTRMMPDPLDAAFAALGNNQAAALLKPTLESYGYAPDLAAMRELADAHGSGYWNENLYNAWLFALRALSPDATTFDKLPSVAKTEAWGRRLLNTQLASWAELRHDTILYAKQSYTGGIACEFPDAFVDPYPAFYAAVASYAAKGQAVVAALDTTGAPTLAAAGTYFARLQQIMGMLQEMAEFQRDGVPFTDTHMQFINEAVQIQNVCGGGFVEKGWYKELFFGDPLEYKPTIADVHTQPTDEGGNEVGRILHVGTGMARLMVTSVETCQGPRAYAGLVSSYFERITEQWVRLDDEAWKQELAKTPPPAEVPWMDDLVAK